MNTDRNWGVGVMEYWSIGQPPASRVTPKPGVGGIPPSRVTPKPGVGGIPASSVLARPLAGFTLIEVCIAVAVAGFALVALLAVMGDSMVHGRRATDETKATLIQQRIMRDLRSQPFGSVNVPSDTGPAHNVDLTGSNVYAWSFGRDLQYLGTGSRDGRYFLARLLAVTNAPGLTRISLAVTWIDGQPRPTTNTLHTWVGQRE